MNSVEGYSSLQMIHQSPLTLVYSATRNRDGASVVLRQLRAEVASPDRIAQLAKEFELLSQIKSDHVIRAEAFIPQPPTLVMENCGGKSLAALLLEQRLSVREVINIAVAITSGLDRLHANNVIHKDINPANLVYNRATRQLKIIDLGIATAFRSSVVKIEPGGSMEGTLAYIAPEQTGRVNRSIDYRTDFYALGATLYELLTGQTPFETDDTLELVYRHIAVTPPYPSEIDESIPRGLCNVVMRLLAKMPEDRYQSTAAIKQDLMRCLELLDQSAAVDDISFEVGLDDIPEQLNISERLLERESQFREMRACLAEAASGGNEVVVCNGDAGVGKSALIRELQKEVGAYGGYFLTGKHNHLSPDRPYSGVSAAFGDLARQTLARPDLDRVRQRVAAALGTNQSLIVELVPELKLLLGDQQDDKSTEPQPADFHNRLAEAIAGLIGAIRSDDKPFVLSIENLHWIDPASLKFFESLVANQHIPYFMLICAYNYLELPDDSEIRHIISRIGKNNPLIKRTYLDNLSIHAVATVVAESLYRPIEETIPLATIIHTKTNGNPLSVREFLIDLNRKEIIRFDREHREWVWDNNAVSQAPPTDNVGKLLAERIDDLEPLTAYVLKVASCVGDVFDLNTIRSASGLSYSEASTRLLHATGEGYLVRDPRAEAHDTVREIGYRFAHERIQQTAYSMLTPVEQAQIHTRIGQSYLQSHSHDTDDNIFEIVNQLNSSFESPDTGVVDKVKLAELNLKAGRKAKKSAASQSSFKYFKIAIALYGQNIWAHYDISLEMHLEAAETAYLCGDQKQLDFLIERILQYAQSPLDQVRAYEIKLRALIGLDDVGAAIILGYKVLELLGVSIPRKTSRLRNLALILKLLWQSTAVSKNGIQNSKPMSDPMLLAAMRILMILCQAGYLSGNRNTSSYILSMTELSLRHGLAPESSFAFPMFGALLIAYLGAIESGYGFGMLTSDKLDNLNKALHCKTVTLAHIFIRPWKHPLHESTEALTNAYRIGMETGDIEFALIAGISSSISGFILGNDLNSIEVDLAAYNLKASEFNQTPILGRGSLYQQAASNLIRANPEPWMLNGDIYSENSLLQFHEDNGDESSIATLHIVKLFLAVLFRREELALDYAKEVRARLTAVVSSPVVPFFTLYESLACISRLPHSRGIERLRLMARVRLNQRKLRKWSHYAPANVAHSYHLVKAELGRISGRPSVALEHYDKAIRLAHENGYLKEHALANELAAHFHISEGNDELGLFYLRHARASYVRWGAMAKVSQLERKFTRLVEEDYAESHDHQDHNATSLGNLYARNFRGESNLLDLGSVIKASQVLSGEIILGSLLERLMQVVLENAGAHSASLILAREDELVLEITSHYDGNTWQHERPATTIEEAAGLPISVVQYVSRAQEDVVLNDARNEGMFTQDAYIVSRRARSILCIPILSKLHLTGVLYLENLQTTSVFTQDRVAILKLLASQSAIAIENAKLYQQLNDSRNKYLALYQNAVEGIFELDGQGRVTNINPAGAKLIGFDSPDQVLAQQDFEIRSLIMEPDDLSRLQEELLAEGRVVGYEMQIRRRDQQTRWIALSAREFKDEDNHGEFRIEGAVIDITERKLREAAEQAKRLAETATASKSQFLANMSHEIRTPMNAIVGYTDLALRTDRPGQKIKYLETIRSSSNHLLRVVNDILDLSKVESGKFELQRSPFRLTDIFQDMNNLFSLDARARGLSFKVPSLAVPDDALYTGDSVRIGQILINLVSNALKFTDTGEVKVAVEPFDMGDHRVRINFAVSDTGIGIEDSQLEHIFESFVQGNLRPGVGGTGLGLAICDSLVKLMGGHIYAVSEPDKGSNFYFSVIVDQCDDRPSTLPCPDDERSTGRLIGRKILIVEDNKINQDLAREVLTHAGLQVSVASDGAEALERLDNEPFFAVLMDLRMPVMDGIDTIKCIRANEALASLPAVALSAGVLKSEVEGALASGFDHYLSKPVNFDELLQLLVRIGDSSTTARREPHPLPIAQAHIRQPAPGIDFERALRNHAKDIPLLMRLMAEFQKIYEYADDELREFIRQNEGIEARRLAHNVAGVAGSFGGMKLTEVARAMEHGLATGSEEDLEPLLSAFSSELAKFVAAIEQFQLESHTLRVTAG